MNFFNKQGSHIIWKDNRNGTESYWRSNGSGIEIVRRPTHNK